MRRFAGQVWIIARKDLLSEVRNREVIYAALSFAVVVLLMFSFAFDPNSHSEVRDLAGGLLWIVFIFAGVLVLNRSFARESANDCLEALVASPVSGDAIFLGKTIASWALILVVELFCLPIVGIFFDVNWTPKFGPLLGIFALGTWAFASVGTTFGAITANNRLRELMLPLLLFPICLPALIACVSVTWGIFDPEAVSDLAVWVKMLIGFDIIYTLLGILLLDLVLTSG